MLNPYIFHPVSHTCNAPLHLLPVSPCIHVCVGKAFCDGSSPAYSCPSGLTLNIVSAFFGGTYTAMLSTCVAPKPANCKLCAVGCTYPNALSVVESKCSGKNACNISFATSPFGKDLCVNTIHYLQVNATCCTQPVTALPANSPPSPLAPIPIPPRPPSPLLSPPVPVPPPPSCIAAIGSGEIQTAIFPEYCRPPQERCLELLGVTFHREFGMLNPYIFHHASHTCNSRSPH